MKCPNCDKEVSPEFNVCPWCGYMPKKCNKPEHQDVWLPVEARFCPRCGEPLLDEKARGIETRESNDYPNENLEFDVEGVTFNMMYVKGGSFLMGATSEQGNDGADDEKPIPRVTLSDYYIGETVVTQALWKVVMGDNPSYFKGESLPVESVSWGDCQEFLKELNHKTGKTFRLPTEAEWEYAARGGRKSQCFKYAGNNDVNKVAWFDGNSGGITHPVKQKNANELGLYDMSGNVWEWCQDWYASNYNSSAQANPTGPSTGSLRVLRGGCRISIARGCRLACRNFDASVDRSYYNGFRLVLK